jgi:hypothetical protein
VLFSSNSQLRLRGFINLLCLAGGQTPTPMVTQSSDYCWNMVMYDMENISREKAADSGA